MPLSFDKGIADVLYPQTPTEGPKTKSQIYNSLDEMFKIF